MLVIWDGASYHKSKDLREFLAQVNQELSAKDKLSTSLSSIGIDLSLYKP